MCRKKRPAKKKLKLLDTPKKQAEFLQIKKYRFFAKLKKFSIENDGTNCEKINVNKTK